MRKPNGYGSIKHLSGRRRRPFVFVVSQEGRQKPVEYFASQIEAEIFAADYNKIHRNASLADHELTFEELYHRWLSRHIADTNPSASAICGYKNAFRHCSVLHGMAYSEIKYVNYQRIIDDMRKISDNKSGDIVNPNNNGFTHVHGGTEGYIVLWHALGQ